MGQAGCQREGWGGREEKFRTYTQSRQWEGLHKHLSHCISFCPYLSKATKLEVENNTHVDS